MLGPYLERAARTPWAWGSHDCCTFPGDWVAMHLGADPIMRWRGRYNTEAEAEALIADAGGLVELWTTGLQDALCPETWDDPAPGDVAVINVVGEGGPTQVGALFGGKRWVTLAPRGIVAIPHDWAAPIRRWRP